MNRFIPPVLVFTVSLLAAAAFAPSVGAEPAHRVRLGDLLRGELLVIPAEWSGIWESELTDYVCGTNDVIDTESYVDTLCTGQSIDPNDEIDDLPFAMDCSGSTVTATTVTADCTGGGTVGLCTVSITFSLDGVRNGDTFTSTQEYSIDLEPNGIFCGNQPDECVRTEVTATRIAPEPPGCATPVDATWWGEVKARYR